LAGLDEVHRGRVGGESFGWAGEAETFELVKLGAEVFSGEEGAEFGVMVDEMAADGEELFALGHVDTGGDGELRGAEVEVEATAGGLFEALAGPPGGHA